MYSAIVCPSSPYEFAHAPAQAFGTPTGIPAHAGCEALARYAAQTRCFGSALNDALDIAQRRRPSVSEGELLDRSSPKPPRLEANENVHQHGEDDGGDERENQAAGRAAVDADRFSLLVTFRHLLGRGLLAGSTPRLGAPRRLAVGHLARRLLREPRFHA